MICDERFIWVDALQLHKFHTNNCVMIDSNNNNHLKINRSGNRTHRLRVISKNSITLHANGAPFKKLLEPRHTTVTNLFRQTIVFRQLGTIYRYIQLAKALPPINKKKTELHHTHIGSGRILLTAIGRNERTL